MVHNIPSAVLICAFLVLLLHSNLVLIELKRGLNGKLSRGSSVVLYLLCLGSAVIGGLMWLSVVPGEAATASALTSAGALVPLVVATYSRILEVQAGT